MIACSAVGDVDPWAAGGIGAGPPGLQLAIDTQETATGKENPPPAASVAEGSVVVSAAPSMAKGSSIATEEVTVAKEEVGYDAMEVAQLGAAPRGAGTVAAAAAAASAASYDFGGVDDHDFGVAAAAATAEGESKQEEDMSDGEESLSNLCLPGDPEAAVPPLAAGSAAEGPTTPAATRGGGDADSAPATAAAQVKEEEESDKEEQGRERSQPPLPPRIAEGELKAEADLDRNACEGGDAAQAAAGPDPSKAEAAMVTVSGGDGGGGEAGSRAASSPVTVPQPASSSSTALAAAPKSEAAAGEALAARLASEVVAGTDPERLRACLEDLADVAALNESQRAAVAAALTRRCTIIQVKAGGAGCQRCVCVSVGEGAG